MRSFSRAHGSILFGATAVALLTPSVCRAQTVPDSGSPALPTASPAQATPSGAEPPPPAAHESQDGAPAPFHRVLHFDKTLVAGGASIFAPLYLASALAASDGYDSPDGSSNPRAALWIPAVGPFIMLGTSSAAADVFLVLDGLGQIGGLTLLVYGIASPRTVLVPREATPTASKVDVVPLVGPGLSGAAVFGTF